MPKTPEGVRRLFDASALGSWSPSHPSLPFYAQLHLTIMAASADEELHGEGDFRRRLAQMLGLPIVDYLQGRHLPQLWEKARRWSERRAEKGDAVRRLVLPDPGNQTIIGYSKRLAFPGFLDQNQLADFLGEEDMDADAPTTRLLSSLRARKHRFSERFQMEFDRWAACWESGDSENALHTPFWAAMLETTWRREQEPAHGRAHGCTLEIDPMEPRDLAVWLYGPSTVRGVAAWRLDENDRLNDGRVRWRHSRDGRPGALLDIVKERARRDAPTLGRFGKTLMQGVLIFGQDEEGRWFDVPVFPASGTIWLILNDAYSSLLGAPRGSAQGEPVQRARLQGS
ncbi:hypothetical protein U5801_25470, partial [Lamprobacter modestohalophilus]|uniref:hypothetical protein n=1 Tax=Lamprobacter modestohalophilus TaxID=1064514 RepID=UPI002ADED281